MFFEAQADPIRSQGETKTVTNVLLGRQPNQYALHVTLINFIALVKRGIRFLIVDVDNNLRPIKRRRDPFAKQHPELVKQLIDEKLLLHENEFDLASVMLLKQLLAEGTIQGICLVSNVVVENVPTAKHRNPIEAAKALLAALAKSAEREDRIRRLATIVGTEHVVLCCGRNCKPKPWGFNEALRLMGASANETAVIGDQLFTDVKGGNAVGCYTIWTKPLPADKWYTAWKRLPEAVLLLMWQHLYLAAYITAFLQAAQQLQRQGHTEFLGFQLAQAHQQRIGEKHIVASGQLSYILDQMVKQGYLWSRVEESSIAETEKRSPRRIYMLSPFLFGQF